MIFLPYYLGQSSHQGLPGPVARRGDTAPASQRVCRHIYNCHSHPAWLRVLRKWPELRPRPEGLCPTLNYVSPGSQGAHLGQVSMAGGHSLHSQKGLSWKEARGRMEVRPPFPAGNNIKGRPSLHPMPAPPPGLDLDIALCVSASPSALPKPLSDSSSLLSPRQLWKLRLRMVKGSWVSTFTTLPLAPVPCPFYCLRPLPSTSGPMEGECGAHVCASQALLGISVGAQSRRELWGEKSLRGHPGGEEEDEQSHSGGVGPGPWLTKYLFFPSGERQVLSHWTAK